MSDSHSLGALPRINAAYGQGSSVQPILLDDVRCIGHEHRLIDCSYLVESHDCNHGQDAGVICLQGNLFQLMIVQSSN